MLGRSSLKPHGGAEASCPVLLIFRELIPVKVELKLFKPNYR
ncbi:MAG: hypothetical protein QXS79_02665 [Candidatus Bathyarchaeia archaeon]